LLPVPDNIDDVDTTVPPMSAEHYLAQVIASRRSCPMVVRSEVKRKPVVAPPTAAAGAAEEWPFGTPPFSSSVSNRSEFAPTEEWVQAKVAAFCAHRDQLNAQKDSIPKMNVEWPAMSDSKQDDWVAMALEECAPEAIELKERFPAHKGTPPSMRIIAAMSTAQIHFLLCALLDNCDDEEAPSEAVLQWIHSLLLFADLPIMPDVCSSLRAFVRVLRTRRATEEREATRLQYSLFIALAANAFGQKDLAD
ncbi:hypothetical protein PFISCL1PPCAC_9272, partial [Pristionchus fissidentatus]